MFQHRKQVGFVQVLVLDNLFYVIALLNMPKVWMTGVFLFSVKEASETLVATSRFFRFLHEVEALVPAQNSPKGAEFLPISLRTFAHRLHRS